MEYEMTEQTEVVHQVRERYAQAALQAYTAATVCRGYRPNKPIEITSHR